MSNMQPPYDPSQQYGAGGPQPPKKSPVGLIAAILALVVVAVAVVVALVFTLNGDDDDKNNDAKGDDTESSQSSEPTDDTESSQSSEPTDDGGDISGDGYSYDLPGGWSDRTSELDELGGPASIDTVSAWGNKLDGSRANVIVEVAPAGGQTDPQAIKSSWAANVTNGLDVEPVDIDGITVAGNETVGIRLERKNDKGVDIVQLAYLAIKDDKAYSIGLSTKPEDEDEATGAFEEMIASWAWE